MAAAAAIKHVFNIPALFSRLVCAFYTPFLLLLLNFAWLNLSTSMMRLCLTSHEDHLSPSETPKVPGRKWEFTLAWLCRESGLKCSVTAAEPHPPTQDSLLRLLSHSVRGRALQGPWPRLGAQGLGYRKKLSASYKHEGFCTHDKLAPEGMLQRRHTVCVKPTECKKSRVSHHRYSKLHYKHLCC